MGITYTQALISLVAIMLLSGLAWWLYPVKSRLSQQRVYRNFSRCFPSETIIDSLFSEDHTTALLQLANEDMIGLVFCMGDRIVCRKFEKSHLQGICPRPDKLILKTHDFTIGNISFSCSADILAAAQKLIPEIKLYG